MANELEQYIVIFNKDVPEVERKQQIAAVKDNGGTIVKIYDSIIMQGFVATIPDSHLQTLQSLQGNIISSIEPNGVVTTQ